MMNRKYVFLDIDGTLVDGRGRMPDSTYIAIQKAQQNGHRMILATGRQRSQIYSWLTEKIRFDGIIASSGAYIEDSAGKIIFASRPSRERLSFAINFFRKNATPYCIQTAEAVVTEQWCMQPMVDMFRGYGFSDEVVDSIFSHTVIMDKPEECKEAEKMSYYNSPMKREAVRKELGSYFYVTGYSLSNGMDTGYFGEITFEGVNKAAGIQKYMDAVGAPITNTIAIGDSENDTEMIAFAQTGVAMGNASRAIKEIADMVTAAIDEDGIEKAFTVLGLI